MIALSHTKIFRVVVRLVNKICPILLAKMRFRKLFKRKLDLNNPQDLNEKILYLSLCTDTSKWVELADKYKVRKYVEACGLGNILVKFYGKWDNVEDIKWEVLPDSFVLKTNNGCGTVLVVESKSMLNVNEVKNKLRVWLKKKIGAETAEFHYARIKPCIIAEELLHPTEEELKISSSIIDYKVWCLNGKPYCILTCTNRTQGQVDLSVYDLDWKCHVEYLVSTNSDKIADYVVPKPKSFDMMLDASRILSKGFPIVRVDFYDVDGSLYFGELTFTSFGGTMTYFTQDYLLEMGKQVKLYD